jgi:hypothetical protein
VTGQKRANGVTFDPERLKSPRASMGCNFCRNEIATALSWWQAFRERFSTGGAFTLILSAALLGGSQHATSASCEEGALTTQKAAAEAKAASGMRKIYFEYWPGDQPAHYRLGENLLLAIPPQYQEFWVLQNKVVRDPDAQAPKVTALSFTFFLPDFCGFTPDNFTDRLSPDRVDIVWLQPETEYVKEKREPAYYPPGALKRMLDFKIADSRDYDDKYGLRCYRAGANRFCYGSRDPTAGEDIMLDVEANPLVHPMRRSMKANYFTARHGGLVVIWVTDSRNLPRWRDIDVQIWKFIEAWNLKR